MKTITKNIPVKVYNIVISLYHLFLYLQKYFRWWTKISYFNL